MENCLIDGRIEGREAGARELSHHDTYLGRWLSPASNSRAVGGRIGPYRAAGSFAQLYWAAVLGGHGWWLLGKCHGSQPG